MPLKHLMIRKTRHLTISLLCSMLLLLSAGSDVTAREYSYLHFQVRDGLPGNNIYCITQDQDGFIWIATETGLSRFDGTSFKNYTAKEGLPGNEVYALYADHKNRVWILPFKKDICYYYKGKIYNKSNSRLIRQIPVTTEAKAVVEDINGRILVTSFGCYVLIHENDSCTVYHPPVMQPGFFIPLAGTGTLWREILDPSFFRLKPAATDLVYNLKGNRHQNPYTILSKDNIAWVYTGGHNIATIPIPPDNNSGYTLYDSLYVFNTRSGCRINDVKTGLLSETLLPGIGVNATFIDRENGIWIGGTGSGLYYFPPGRNTSITRSPENTQLQIRNFYRSGSRLLVSTGDARLWETDPMTFALRHSIDSKKVPAGTLVLPEGNIYKPANDLLPEILSIPEILQLPGIIPGTGSNLVKSVALSGDSLLVATHMNLGIVSRHGGKTRLVWNTRATCAYMPGENCYVGTLDGLYTFPGKDTMIRNAGNSRLLAKGVFVSLAMSRQNGLLWAITSDNGVYCFRNHKLIRNINESNGLSGNICKCIFTDGRRVFIGTSNGLNVIDPDSNFSIRQYYTLDGLVSNDINCVYAAGSRIWAGTSEGYSVLDISPQPEQSSCNIIITDIMVSGKHFPADTTNMLLPPQASNIAFSYSGISFRSMGKMKYRYRLLGLSDSWQTTMEQALAYPSLPAGNYRFELVAVNRYGASSKTVSVPFTVKEYWWKQWWVQLTALFFLLFLTTSILLYRAKRIRVRDQEKSQLKAKIVELEQMALRAQMNPHFIFNSLNSFYQYVINRDLAGASKFMNDFSTLIRLLFEITALKEISLYKEIHFLTTYLNLEQTKLNHSFFFAFRIQEDIITEEVSIPTFILQPFIENSIRHGVANLKNKQGKIDIHITGDVAGIRVTIEDNGPGRVYTAAQKSNQASIHNSRGIALTEERIALYNETRHTNIRIETVDKYAGAIPAGTLVHIYFPTKDKP